MSDAILCLGYAILFAGAFVLAGLVYVGRVLRDFRDRTTNVNIESHHHFAGVDKMVDDPADGDLPDDGAYMSALNVPDAPDIATDGEPATPAALNVSRPENEPAWPAWSDVLPDPKPAPAATATPNLDELRTRLDDAGIDYRRWRIACPVPGLTDEEKAYNWLHGWKIFLTRYRRWEADHVRRRDSQARDNSPATRSADPQSDLIAWLRKDSIDLVRFRDWLISYQLLDAADPIEGLTDDNATTLLQQFDYYRERYAAWLSANPGVLGHRTPDREPDIPVGRSEDEA